MPKSTITLHPHASDFLFKHFRSMNRIFRDALGLLEIDYVSIALITPQNELLFFSSRPSLEWKMIDCQLWQFDERFHESFFMQEDPKIWENSHKSAEFHVGLSIPSVFERYRVVYTFASKSNDKEDQIAITGNIAMLTRIGRYCLKKIFASVHLPVSQEQFSLEKPQLKLVINNTVPYENIT